MSNVRPPYPEMYSGKKSCQWYFGMEAHIGVDADSGLVYTVRGMASHVADVTEGNSLLHGEEPVVCADAGYQGADKRADSRPAVRWQVAMRPGKRKSWPRKTVPSTHSLTKRKSAKQASAPRWSIRFAWSSASLAT